MKAGKVWGETQLIFKNDNFEVHRIKIHLFSYCSKHKHNYKHNIFYIESGNLSIKTWKNDYDLIDTTHLKAGEMIDISPGEFHQFESFGNETIAYEIYYSKPISNDIIRDTCGGKN